MTGMFNPIDDVAAPAPDPTKAETNEAVYFRVVETGRAAGEPAADEFWFLADSGDGQMPKVGAPQNPSAPVSARSVLNLLSSESACALWSEMQGRRPLIYRSKKIVSYRGPYLRSSVCSHPHLLCQWQCFRPRSPIGQAFSSSDAF